MSRGSIIGACFAGKWITARRPTVFKKTSAKIIVTGFTWTILKTFWVKLLQFAKYHWYRWNNLSRSWKRNHFISIRKPQWLWQQLWFWEWMRTQLTVTSLYRESAITILYTLHGFFIFIFSFHPLHCFSIEKKRIDIIYINMENEQDMQTNFISGTPKTKKIKITPRKPKKFTTCENKMAYKVYITYIDVNDEFKK